MARCYDLAIARWTSMDLADGFHKPRAHVRRDPANLVDPGMQQVTCGEYTLKVSAQLM